MNEGTDKPYNVISRLAQSDDGTRFIYFEREHPQKSNTMIFAWIDIHFDDVIWLGEYACHEPLRYTKFKKLSGYQGLRNKLLYMCIL